MTSRSTVALVLAAGAAALALSCSGGAKEKGGGKGGPPAFPVETAEVKSRPVEYTVTAVGSVDAFEKVQVTARVAGVVEQVKFVEGETVEAGTPLVEIELRRYQLAVEAARANLQKAEAAKADAEAALARRKAVVEKNPGLIPGEEIATFATRVQTAAADVAQAKSALDQAELNLRDAFVRAPVSGRIETRTVTTGQYVSPGGVLATLVRRDPLLLRFQVPSEEARSLRPALVARFRVPGDAQDFAARITHVAGAADATSRMVAVTAQVDDPRRALLRPGAFADVKVPVGGPSQAPVIPQTAIRPSEKGFLAFVVEDGKARERVLTLGLRTAEGLVEVRGGLKAGEQLVVRGAEALRDGLPVAVSPAGDAPASAPRPEARG